MRVDLGGAQNKRIVCNRSMLSVQAALPLGSYDPMHLMMFEVAVADRMLLVTFIRLL